MGQPAKWTEQDLLELIHLKQEEGLQLEFKRAESLEATDKKKTEISKDVSAFANSAGGTIVYGIAESSKEPRSAEDLSPIDPSKSSKEWLEQIIGSRIQPRIQGFLVNPISLKSTHPGQFAYVVSIPESTTAHQAFDRRYYKRYNFESVPMEDYEVRLSMNRGFRAAYKLKLAATQVSDRTSIRTFHLECILQNISESLGRDVSVVIFLPKHTIIQPDDFEISIDGGTYSRIPGTWVDSSNRASTAMDAHPLAPYRVFFGRELAFSLPGYSFTPLPLKVYVKVFDQFGLALIARVLFALPGLEVISTEELPSPGLARQPNISSF